MLRVTKNPLLVTHQLEGELVIYDPDRDVVHNLNPTARVVWDNCDGHQDVAAIAGKITSRFSITNKRAKADVEQTLQQFKELGLIHLEECI
jgi:hypothetical protein